MFSEIKHPKSACHNYFTSKVIKSSTKNSENVLELCFFISGRWIGKKYGKKWSLRNQTHIYEKNSHLFLIFYHILSAKLSFSHKISPLNFYKHFDYFSSRCGKIIISKKFQMSKSHLLSQALVKQPYVYWAILPQLSCHLGGVL